MRDHKSLLAWQEANAVVRAVMLGTRRQRHPLVDQLQRATLSVQLNVAEGYALKSSKRFRNHLDIAYASAVEAGDLLELCGEMELLPPDVSITALARCHRSQQLIRGLINRIRRE
jgi:four helix bundle protein